MDDRLWVVALEGLLARYGRLNWTHERTRDVAAQDELFRLLAYAAPDWRVVRATMGKSAEAHFYAQISALDDTVRKMSEREIEMRIPLSAERQAAYLLGMFVDELQSLRRAAEPTVSPAETPKQSSVAARSGV
jgi:hypothetical protein